MSRSFSELAQMIREEPTPGTLSNVLDDLRGREGMYSSVIGHIREQYRQGGTAGDWSISLFNLLDALYEFDTSIPFPSYAEADELGERYVRSIRTGGARKRKTLRNKFCKCIKSVKKTLKARKGSTKERGAIAVCVKSVLQTRGRTMKKFKCGKKPMLMTQPRK